MEMNEQAVHKTYKYKLEPTPKQEWAMEFALRRCRELYNAALQERKEAWQKCGVSVTVAGQSAALPAVKEVRPEYRDIHSQDLQDVLSRLDSAFQRFFARVKNGETPGYPRSHGRNRFNSFTYKQYGDGATFSCADVPIWPLPPTGQETGVGLGIEAFATLSDGTRIFNPGWYRQAERALKTAQRRKRDSHRRKAVTLLAKAHLKVKRQRKDFHQKTALAHVRENDTIYHEDLQVRNMVKNHHLVKSISDAGWSEFLSILSFKAVCAGRSVVAVNSAFTSQICSGCGVVVQTGLSVRWHRCQECGTSLHRDHNAAKNIERLGQSLRGAVAYAAAENRESAGFSRGVSKCRRGAKLSDDDTHGAAWQVCAAERSVGDTSGYQRLRQTRPH
jgi:putative transposase